MSESKKLARASMESLYRIFTVPEAPDSTLGRIDQSISQNLTGFLQEHIVAAERDLADIERDFSDPHIPEQPTFVSDQIQFVMDKLVSPTAHREAETAKAHRG